MKTLLLALLFISASPKVYVCVSGTSARYHGERECGGLKSCTHEIEAMSISAAEQKGKTPCQICLKGR